MKSEQENCPYIFIYSPIAKELLTPEVLRIQRALMDDSWNHPAAKPVVPRKINASRNEPCPCGSGVKFKKCCLNKPAEGT